MKLAIVIIVLLSVIAIDAKDGEHRITMCNTGIEYIIEYRTTEADVRFIVRSKSGDTIFIVAIDTDKDGKYDLLIFDTVGDGMADMQLDKGSATLKQVIELYCQYMNFTMS